MLANISDLEDEKYSYWDTSSELAEKVINNGTRDIIKNMMYKNEGIKFEDESVSRINKLVKNNNIKKVTLLNKEPKTTN